MSVIGMNDPISYNRYNKLQYRDNQICLAKNIQRMVWKGNDRVLDIGSGDGSFTANVLRLYLPDDIEVLVGCDKSGEMVDFANEHYQQDRVKFQVLEIGKNLPAEYFGSYDHIFAFFSLHWIRDQKLAITQVYDILSDGGDCLLLIVGHFPSFFEVYRRLSKSKRWSCWVKDLEELISPYHDSVDPESKLKNIGNDVGFKNVFVKCNKSTYTFASVEDFKNMAVSINPFDIPHDLMRDYLEDLVQVAKDEGYLSEKLTISYTTNTFSGRK